MRSGFFIISLLFLFSAASFAQSSNIGVRAGLNYSKFRGEVESYDSDHVEELGFSGGFHFGLSYQYNFTDLFGLRSELLYIQNGGTRKYKGPSFYILRTSDEAIFDQGNVDYFLDVSNAYISIPVTLHFKPLNQFEFLAGVYGNVSIGPNGNGRIIYESTIDEDDIFFTQTLRHNYNSDEALEGSFSAGSTRVFLDEESGIVGDDISVDVPNIAGAYFNNPIKEMSLYKKLDFGLIVGGSYYFNRGFYFTSRLSYGFRDLTNEQMDFSISRHNDNKTLITRDDNDRHLGLEFSLGFKF